MTQITVETLKAQTAEYVARANTGEQILVIDQDRPVAVLRGVADDPQILQAAERRRLLAQYATWDAEDLAEFEEALAAQRTIDDEIWR